MKRFWKWLVGILFVLVAGCLIVFYMLGYYSPPEKFNSTTDITIDTSKPVNSDLCKDINACIIKGDALTKKLPQDSQSISQQDVNPGNIQEGHVMAEYKVEGDKITQTSKDKLAAEQQQMAQKQFEFFTQLVPAEWRQNLTKYMAMEKSNLSAYITRLGDTKKDGQALGVDIYNMDRTADPVAKLILVHEFAHLFSDNYDQYKNQQSCEGTVTDQNFYCLNDDSYLNQFYLSFWKNVPKDWKENSTKDTPDIVKFYQLNQDKFITTYAASNPYEDFAESFTEFVVKPSYELKQGTQANEKIEFFYQYPELVLLRYQLLQQLTQ